MVEIKTKAKTKVGSTLRKKGWTGLADEDIAAKLVAKGLAEYARRKKQVADNDSK